MPKKSDAAKADKSHKTHSPKQGRAQKSSRGERPDKAVGRQKKDRKIKPPVSTDKVVDGIEKLPGGRKSKDGCLPKVFMLLLPFAGIGAYIFLHL